MSKRRRRSLRSRRSGVEGQRHTVPRALASLICAVAVSIVSAAHADDGAPYKHHELGMSGLVGYGITGYDYYDSTLESVGAWGLGFEYAYRLSPHFRVGGEGMRTAFGRKGLDEATYATLWNATPFVGATWGSGAIQGGVRLGVGFAYGGRTDRPAVSDRHGPGADAHLLGELAACGPNFDVFARLGFRFTYTSWDAPHADFYPTDFPVGMLFASVGGRLKI
jgi:hypothetical protein